jgi:outer membrane protein assembly factor BamB
MFALDAKNGDLKYNMTSVPAGTIYYGLNGELLKYQLVNYGTAANPNFHLLRWNSSHVVAVGRTGASDAWGSNIQGRTYNAAERGYDLNVSIGAGVTLTGSIIYAFPEDRIIVGRFTAQNITLSAVSLKPGEEGRRIFTNENWHSPDSLESIATETYTQSTWSAISQEDYVITFWVKSSRVNHAFSLETGKHMWSGSPQIYADAWVSGSLGGQNVIVYNKLISVAAGGVVYCRDIKNGTLLWTYDADDPYTESYLSPNWWVRPQFVSCGMVYFGHEEHSPQEPKPRGAPYFALDVETGKVVWRIDGAFRQTQWGGRSIIGDSIIATQDYYDSRLYAVGKGPSEMSVASSNAVTTAGSTVLISGTVMDISPGTQSDDAQFRFSNGVPAVSDESMSDWMLYVYKQFEKPWDTKGVEVTVFAQQ